MLLAACESPHLAVQKMSRRRWLLGILAHVQPPLMAEESSPLPAAAPVSRTDASCCAPKKYLADLLSVAALRYLLFVDSGQTAST